MYKLTNLNIVLYFQTANMQHTIKNFQKIYLAPLSYKPPSPISPPSRVLEIDKPHGGLNREITVYTYICIYIYNNTRMHKEIDLEFVWKLHYTTFLFFLTLQERETKTRDKDKEDETLKIYKKIQETYKKNNNFYLSQLQYSNNV